MAQLDGGGGGGDGGDTTNVPDDSNIDGGGTEAVAPPEDIELDSRTGRRLRQDASSDPMAEQTEPEPDDVSPSPTGTTATVNGGDGPTPEDTSEPTATETETEAPSPEGTSATVDGGDAGTGAATPDDSAPTTEDSAIDVSDLEEAGGSTGTSEPEPSGPSPTDAERFGEELGGDPAGDADRTTDTGPTPEDVEPTDTGPLDSRDETTAEVTTGTPGQTGVAPPGADDISGPPEEPTTEIVTIGPDGREVVRSTETGRVLGDPEDVQQQFEQQVETQLEDQTGREVTAGEDFEIVREDGTFQVQLAGAFVGALSREAAREFGIDVTADAGDRQATGPTVESGGFEIGVQDIQQFEAEAAADQAAAQDEARGALEGVGFFDEQAEAQQELREQVEEDIEGQVGSGRAERAGITNPTLRENVVGNVDLEEGEDFTLDIRQMPGGRITVDAELTEEFTQAEAERSFERELRNQFGVDVEAGEDFEVVPGEDDGFEVELTERGAGRVQLSTLDRTVRDIERGDIPVFTDATGIRGPRFNIPGEGAAVPEATDTSILTIEEDTYTLADLGEDFNEAVRGGLDVLESNITEREAELREADVSITGGRGTGQPNPLREATFAGVGDFASLLGQGVGLPTRASRLVAAGIESGREGQLGEFTETASVTGQRLPAEFASGQIGRFRDEPVRATGGLVGTLVGSALVMRAVPRSRFLIQPGEEIAGIGGFALTRRVAGERAAQRLFPNQEPLIFSEEAAIRTARAIGGRTSRGLGRVESGAASVTGRARSGVGERVRRAPSVRLETDPEAGFVAVDPMVRARFREVAQRPGEAVRGGLESIRRTPERVRTGAVETGRDVLDRGEQAIERGRQTLTRVGLEADDAAFRAGQRTAAGVERAGELPREIVESPGAVARGVQQRGVSAIETGRQRLTLAELQAEQLGFRAGARTAEGVARFEDALGTVAEVPGQVRTGAGRVRAAPRETVAGFQVGRGAAGVSDIPGFEAFPGQIQTGRAFEAGFEAGETTAELGEQVRGGIAGGRDRLIDTGETLVELPSRGREGAADLLSTGRQRLTLAELQAEEFGFRSGARTAEGVNRLLDLDPAEFVSGRVTGAVETGRQQVTALELRAEDFGFRAGQRTAAGVESVERFPSRLSSLSDLTVRIEPGIPRRPVVADTAFEFGETEADAPEPFAGPFETEDTGVEDAPLDPFETGRGEGPVLLGVESRLEAPARFETEVATEPVAPRLETTLVGDVFGQTAPAIDVGVESSVATGEVIIGDIRGGQMERVRLGLEEELGLDLEQEAEQEIETEFEFEAPLDLELELEQEVRAEAEAEFEIEGDFETEAEFQRFDDERPVRDEDDLFPVFDEDRELLERELLNPLTGR